ncbi:MAG: hypothetical protein R3244_08615, partial [Thermoanaerobaculia bacterium]|nr:hypothetical protein [Thermoanaerobaculia bacterium]
LRPTELACQMAILSTEQLRWERTPERLATARRWVDEASAAAPGDGDVVAIEARYQEVVGDRETAEALYRRSVYLDARQGRTYAYYVRFLLDGGEGVEGVAEDVLAEARLLVARARELAPFHPWIEALEDRLGPSRRSAPMAGASSHPQP